MKLENIWCDNIILYLNQMFGQTYTINLMKDILTTTKLKYLYFKMSL